MKSEAFSRSDFVFPDRSRSRSNQIGCCLKHHGVLCPYNPTREVEKGESEMVEKRKGVLEANARRGPSPRKASERRGEEGDASVVLVGAEEEGPRATREDTMARSGYLFPGCLYSIGGRHGVLENLSAR